MNKTVISIFIVLATAQNSIAFDNLTRGGHTDISQVKRCKVNSLELSRNNKPTKNTEGMILFKSEQKTYSGITFPLTEIFCEYIKRKNSNHILYIAHGNCTEYKDKAIYKEFHVNNSICNGVMYEYYVNNKHTKKVKAINYESTYENGLLLTQKKYFPSGELRDVNKWSDYLKKDKISKWYYSTGEIKRKQIWQGGKLINETYFDCAGSIMVDEEPDTNRCK